ncbi:MAG: putative baseplate assembly protein [Betaproteobacteria bacterium]|nr:putative baseplate assembly protein [Betaproteobacteria bacterium]
MKYFCCEKQRLEIIKLSGSANAIEFLEVRDHLEPDLTLRQRTLFVRLLRPGFTLTPDNVLIDGGERLATIPIEWVAVGNNLPAGTDPALVDGIDDLPRTLVVRTTVFGDFSTYTLHLRANSGSAQPPGGFDPKLSDIEFSFKVECPSDFDCAQKTPCPPEAPAKPDIDYLAKDYSGFRRLMLDRLNLLAPGWRERSAADVGVMLVELMAYIADNLSYRQDAIANEAYLATAHKRVSMRRHVRLVDYALHDGCNARAFVHIKVSFDIPLPQGTQLLTRPSTPMPPLPQVVPGSKTWHGALAAGSIVFETAHPKGLFTDLNELLLYAWGDRGCCLPRGATSATLRGLHPDLQPGDVLVFQEVVSPTTFLPEDADPAKRWAVRLTEVKAGVDPSGQLFDEPPVDGPVDITEIAWDAADALLFPLCLSVNERPGLEVSVALGNVVLVDHGQTVTDNSMDPVPVPRLKRVAVAANAQSCGHPEPEPIPLRFRPALVQFPVTQGFDLAADLRVPLTQVEDWFPATSLIQRDPHDALPRIPDLQSKLDTVISHWMPRRDLLASDGDATDFVVETENDGLALLRFGDDRHGRRPDEGTVFTATYRVGNGMAGNVGADAIAHIVTNVAGVFTEVTNPLPAVGGIDPENIEAARRDAPQAFRTQERAVTVADYAAAAERRADVQRAAATFRWTGSWHTVFVTADRFGGAAIDARFKVRLRRHLERFRMAGYDLDLDGPSYVALDITLHICVLSDYFRSEVLRAVQVELGTGVLPDGRLAVFHPDNFSFGEAMYLSRIVAAAQAVEGVEAVWVQKFERLGQPDSLPMETGVLPMGRLEIAQLANDPNFRERGRLTLEAGGGK